MELTTLKVDKSLPMPAYLQLKEQLRKAILSGKFPAGSVLPPERELAETLGLSRMTVRRALEELAVSCYIKQRQGSGTYVLPRRLEQPVDRVLGFSDEAKVLGFKAGSVLLEAKQVMAAEEVAEALQIKEGETVLKISRLRTADDEPLAIQISHLAPSLKDLSIEKLKAVGSLYQAVYEQYGITPTGAKQTVSARLPTARELELLAISEITPVLALERITFTENHVPFEYVQSTYRSDRYKMLLDLSA